jgi:hypothetical protein
MSIMARGWESKAVEEQISAREAQSQETPKPRISSAEAARRSRHDGLLLARARTVAALESTKDQRYRSMLEGALAHLDSEIAVLET